ncbi:MAG: pyridoxamine 5'-phosphate oxidase family protein [bacterium]|nr:pyridoxamine 5'-phosphate oxidase family protein [bacterium]
MEPITKTEVLKFLRAHPECVLATVSPEGKPEAATVLFAVDDDFVFYFGTFEKYRKYQNLAKNKQAAIVVGATVKEPKSAQIEGVMEPIEHEADITKTKIFFAEQNPAMKPFFASPLKFFKLHPAWLRFLDETKSEAENFQQIIP